ncbi:type II toxin-antitoxin system VapC family toxin [Arvimicrobium flavum]|uniref:type II toxin-antitoxin system VapC family toxin n=1 Tax=Arvimicrobium flavum TaxID=3393320 RepID=UPI00237AC523|nr:type II toxin-antitoxin system VapC family toxin [Mesorhizobium shangrilense]
MSGFLLDTSVLSTFAPDRPPVPPHLQRWIIDQGAKNTLFTSSIVVLEIQRGISRLHRSGGATRAARLEGWLMSLLDDFSEQTLAVDTTIAREAGILEDALVAGGRHPGLADIVIAATALVNDLVVLTSNSRHFDVLKVRHLDPATAEL